MAFASTMDTPDATGKGLRYGGYASSGGSTGGDISTGFNVVLRLFLQPIGAAVIATQSVVNENFPLSGGDVTIVTTANETGNWIALGY